MQKINLLLSLVLMIFCVNSFAFNTVNNTDDTMDVWGTNANGHYEEPVNGHSTSHGWYQDKPMKLAACWWGPNPYTQVMQCLSPPVSCTVSAHGVQTINGNYYNPTLSCY